jgi:ArsR family transcriptional regulator, cadmium/lead-responsive transcriptional repressor
MSTIGNGPACHRWAAPPVLAAAWRWPRLWRQRYCRRVTGSDDAASRAVGEAANARFFRVLGDPTRLAILHHLLIEPHSVSELTVKLGIAQSRVSNHLACLRWCRFVTAERAGRRVIYSVADQRLQRLIAAASEIASEHRDHLATCRRIGPEWI